MSEAFLQLSHSEIIRFFRSRSKCPIILNDYTAAQPKIDVINRAKQEILAVEEAFRTDSFPFRMLTTLLGISFANCHRGSGYWHGDTRELKPYCLSLAYKLLTYTGDGTQGISPGGGGGGGGSASASRAPSPFPFTATAAQHRMGSLKQVGWKGCAQLKCMVCGTKTTSCCLDCSSSNSVVALCKETHSYNGRTWTTECLKVHAKNPEAARAAVLRTRAAAVAASRPPSAPAQAIAARPSC